MSTVPITTEGRIFVAQTIRDVRARECMSFGTAQADCYPQPTACAHRYKDGSCHIVMVNDEIARAHGWTTEIVRRLLGNSAPRAGTPSRYRK